MVTPLTSSSATNISSTNATAITTPSSSSSAANAGPGRITEGVRNLRQSRFAEIINRMPSLSNLISNLSSRLSNYFGWGTPAGATKAELISAKPQLSGLDRVRVDGYKETADKYERYLQSPEARLQVFDNTRVRLQQKIQNADGQYKAQLEQEYHAAAGHCTAAQQDISYFRSVIDIMAECQQALETNEQSAEKLRPLINKLEGLRGSVQQRIDAEEGGHYESREDAEVLQESIDDALSALRQRIAL